MADERSAAYLNADARDGFGSNGKDSLTIDEAAVRLTAGGSGWAAYPGQPVTVTYAYRSTAPTQMPDDTSGFTRFNQAQINAAELAFRAWSDVANIRFVRVGSGSIGEMAYSNSATMLLSGYTGGQDGAAAFAYFPGSTYAGSLAGDVWVNVGLSYNSNPTLGGYGYTTLLHEIGHAIGLEHPSEYDATAGQTFTYAGHAAYYQDDVQYTVMSYFGEANTGANYAGYRPTTPMLDDIAAVQRAYGANMSTRTGDTVYGFNSNADAPWFVANSSTSRLVFTVWDAGGTDTFDFSQYGYNQVVDLRAGFFSDVGGLVGNVAIAQHASIENAIGGAGADRIHGNAAANALQGGAGADTLNGGGAGADTLFGGDGSDSILGGAGFDQINGNKGEDTIDGGAGGADWLLGGQGNDRITAHAGDAILNGNMGADTVTGGAGADIVRGGQGADLLSGGAGGDRLFGDLGSDTLTGGAGADIFHFAVGGGIDRITDFLFDEGDRIQLDGSPAYSLGQSGADAVVTVGSAGDQIILVGVNAASLGPGAFLLA